MSEIFVIDRLDEEDVNKLVSLIKKNGVRCRGRVYMIDGTSIGFTLNRPSSTIEFMGGDLDYRSYSMPKDKYECLSNLLDNLTNSKCSSKSIFYQVISRELGR